MTCKDCLHFDVCEIITEETVFEDKECSAFEDKSEWVHLPCKVGDVVYLVMPDSSYFDNSKFVVTGWEINSEGERTYRAVCEKDGRLIPLSFGETNIGKTVFLTIEEAEKALDDRRKEDEGK